MTAVELMPVHEFPTSGFWGERLSRANYWGYDPLAFFAPHQGYRAGDEPGCQVNEFKQMVRALHQAGIEVILDVVFNHTCEGNELGPTLSFKGLENQVYYMLEGGGNYYKNYTGCGNTINGNHPIVREMIFLCLRHWVHNYHVDGFRFDLASILSRDRNGEMVPNPPVVETIAEDPLLADSKIIAEAWDASGATRSARSPSCDGPSGTAVTATTSAASGAATAARRRPWPRGWPDPATCTRPAAGSRTTASTSSPRTTASR